MADNNPYEVKYDYDDPQPETTPGRRRGTDVVTLIVGIATLLVSAYVLSDGASWMPQFDFRWILASGAVFVGVLLLVASMGQSRRR